MANTTAALVTAYEDAADAVSAHYMVCPDQREVAECNECSHLNRERSDARIAMDADPASKAYRASDEARADRRARSRALTEFYGDTEATHGDF